MLVDQYGRPLNTGQTGDGGAGFQNMMNNLNQVASNVGAGAEALKNRAGQLGTRASNAYQKIGGTKAVAGKYMPLIGGGLALMSDPTNIGGAAGTTLGGMAGAALGAPLGPIGSFAGSAIGSSVGGALGTMIQGGIGNLATAATNSVGNALSGANRAQMGQGISPGAIPGLGGKGVEGFTAEDIAKIEKLSQITGRSQVDIARQMVPIYNETRNADAVRQMQMNQQNAQLTARLNQQQITGAITNNAQSEAGSTVRTMLTAANPYAQSAFQYRG